MRRSLVVVAILVGGQVAVAQADSLRVHARHVLVSYVVEQRAQESGPYNRDNRFIQLPSTALTTELREDLRLRYRRCDANLALRANMTKDVRVASGVDNDVDFDLYARTGSVGCRLNDSLEARVGRGIITWGNATYRNPSNPVFDQTTQTDPVREFIGKDFAELTLRMDNGLSLSALRFFDASSRDAASLHFVPTTVLRMDRTSTSTSAGVNLSRQDGRPIRVGGYWTYTANRALIAYTDLSWRRGSDGLYPDIDSQSAVGWRFADVHAEEKEGRASALLGAAYTFENGWALTGEYLYDENGYTGREREQAQRAAEAADTILHSPMRGIAAFRAAQVLSDSLRPNLKVVGRRHAFVQLLRSELKNRGELAFRVAHDFDHGGGLLAASFTWSFSPSLELLAIGTTDYGSPFDGRVIKGAGLLGLRATF